jgi:hypothetical protein
LASLQNYLLLNLASLAASLVWKAAPLLVEDIRAVMDSTCSSCGFSRHRAYSHRVPHALLIGLLPLLHAHHFDHVGLDVVVTFIGSKNYQLCNIHASCLVASYWPYCLMQLLLFYFFVVLGCTLDWQ